MAQLVDEKLDADDGMDEDVDFTSTDEFMAKYPLLARYSDAMKAPAREIVGRDYEISQLMAAMARPELCNALLLAPPGSGKALADGTLIPVNDLRGYVPIEQLRVGDEVFSDTGQPTRVSGVFPQGKKRSYRVHFDDGTSIVCNDEHLWDVRNQWDRKKGHAYRTLSLRQILDQGLRDNGGRVKWSVPRNGAVERPRVDLPLDPYALGVLIGDGYLFFREGRNSGGPLVVSSEDEEVVSSVSDALGATGYVKMSNNHSWQFLRKDPYVSSRGVEVKYVQQSDLVDLLGGKGVAGTKSVERRIPAVYMQGSVDQRRALLQGLLDTDGNVSTDDRVRCTFSTNSKGLAADLQELLASLGVRSTQTSADRGGRYKNTEYTVMIKSDDDGKLELFRLDRHRDKIVKHRRNDRRFHRSYGDVRIVDVEDLDTETEMTCIKVEAASELFQAGREHIVTHNTALVQAAMLKDTNRIYLEVDLARMISGLNSPDEMAALIKGLFDEAERFSDEEGSRDLVLFIDEFHQVIQLSAAAVEALKPVLAASGARGLRIIAATTFEEFHQYISKNQPLVERLQRINVNPPDQKTTVKILRGMAERYGVAEQFYDDYLYDLIYEYTDRYMPASTQPRKSILVLDSMVGWHKVTKRPMDKELLADVLMESTNVNVAFRVDAVKIKEQLDSKVFSQDLATSVVAKQLQLCVADLHDKTKPMSSFLFTGSTGTGKTELTKQLARLLFGDDQGHLIRFDMSEFARPDSLDLFRSELTKRVWDMGHAVILFDEIEKADSAITRVLLQVLDDGRLSDDHGRQVSFLNTYIVLTTNAGSEIYKMIAQYNVDDTGSGKELMSKMKEIKRSISTTQGDNKFPPELLGRIDAIVPFQPLSRSTQERIVENKLLQMAREVLAKHGIRTKVSDRVLTYLVEDQIDTESDEGGARGAIATLTSHVLTEVATFVNKNPHEKVIRVDIVGKMKHEDKNILKSEAYVEVSGAR